MARSRALSLALLAAACAAGAELAEHMVESTAPASLPGLWVSAGVLTGTLVMKRRAEWLELLGIGTVAMFAVLLLHGHSLVDSFVIAAVSAIDAAVAAWLIQPGHDEPFGLDRLPHALTLVAAATFAPILGAIVAANLLAWSTGDSFFTIWRAWLLMEMLGILTAGPLVIATISRHRAGATRPPFWLAAEMFVVYGLGAIVADGILGARFDPNLRVPGYLLPFLLWPIFRFGPIGSTATNFGVVAVGLWHAARGVGPYVFVGTTSLVLRAQGAMAIVGVSLILLASVIAERKRIAQERAALVIELQRALAEIKTLRGFIPICAWCHKVRDDAGFWQEIEAYIDTHTDATFSHSICPSCTERESDKIVDHALSNDVH